MTIQEIKNLVREVLPGSHHSTVPYKAGVFLLSVLEVGTDFEKVREFCGPLGRNMLPKFERRYRDSHFSTPDGNFSAEWQKEDIDEDTKVVALVLDILVIAGDMVRTPVIGEADAFTYCMTKKAEKAVEEMAG